MALFLEDLFFTHNNFSGYFYLPSNTCMQEKILISEAKNGTPIQQTEQGNRIIFASTPFSVLSKVGKISHDQHVIVLFGLFFIVVLFSTIL